MGSGATAKYGLEYPLGTDAPNVPGDIQTLAQQIDAILAPYAQDLIGNRPAFGKTGRTFTQTDGLAGTTWRDSGADWRALGSRIQPNAIGDVGFITRAILGQTADLFHIEDSAGNPYLKVGSNGATTVAPGIGSASAQAFLSQAGPATQKVIVAKGATSQSGNLFEAQNVSGTALAKIDQNGVIMAIGSGTMPRVSVVDDANGMAALASNRMAIYARYGVEVRGALSGSIPTPNTGASSDPSLTVLPGLAANIGLVVQGVSSQSGRLQEWWDSTTARVASIGPTGFLFSAGGVQVGNTTAPATTRGHAANLSVWGGSQGAGAGGAIIRGVSGQTDSITEWQSNAGLAYLTIDEAGNVQQGVFTGSNKGPGHVNLGNVAGDTTSVVLALRGASGQSADLQQWQDSTPTTLARIDPSGFLYSRGISVANGPNTGSSIFGQIPVGQAAGVAFFLIRDQSNQDLFRVMPTGQIFNQVNAATAVGQITKGFTSQSADLAEWQDSLANILVKITSGGSLVVAPPSPRSSIGAAGPLSLTSFSVSPGSGESGVMPLVVRGAASQAVDLTEWQGSTGTVLAKVLLDGSINGAALFQGGPTLATATVAMENGNLRVGPRGGSVGNAIIRFTPSGFVGTNSDASITCTGGDGVTSNAGTLQSNAQQFIVAGSSASVTPLNVTIPTSPSANIQSWRVGTSASTPVAQITSTGNVQGTGAYTTLSDAVAKSNIRDLVHDPLDVIRRLRPVHFDYSNGAEIDQVGFIAQDVKAVLPNAVTPWQLDRDGYNSQLGLRDSAILAYAVAALQTLLAERDQRVR